MNGKAHVCVRFCLNGDYTATRVPEGSLPAYVEYNRTYRFGQFVFVDGEYVCGGALKQPFQDEFVAKCKARIEGMDLSWAPLCVDPTD